MKVLFVSSANRNGISVIVQAQGKSLQKEGVQVEYFSIIGKGYIGYLSNIRKLRKVIDEINPDIVHAHYSLSAFVASLAGAKPLVVSLMGSDVKVGGLLKNFISFFQWFFSWKAIIVKSEDMYQSLGIRKVVVIPNGVDLKFFYPKKETALKEDHNFPVKKLTFLFLANPSRIAKNFPLADQAFKLIQDDRVELQIVYNIDHDGVPQVINAADVILLTSLWEGSPNIIKEAMACNKPIVSTNVGDVVWLFGDEPGYFLASFEPDDVALKILLALDFVKKNGSTKGKARIVKLGLDSETVAKRVVDVYKKTLRNDN